MSKKIKFGIMGCGTIGATFAGDLKHAEHCKLSAVASRSQEKADLFARKYKAKTGYDSYEKLVADPEVDVVYVATPHPLHFENSLLAINAGKHVLCEKPITMNAGELRQLIAAAKKNKVFLMEGMWTRCFPAMAKIRKWLAADKIGKVMAVQADFGVKFEVGPEHRIFNPELGGGAMLDLGVYPISFASMVFGRAPKKIQSAATFHSPGVDDHLALIFEYDQGELATIGCSTIIKYKHEARIYGQQGMIIVNEWFTRPRSISLIMQDKKEKIFEFPHPGTGFFYEADHVADCIKNGMTESDIMPLAESLQIQQTMDKIRKKW